MFKRKGLVELAVKNGWLRLCFLEGDDVMVSAQIWFVVGATAYIYKLCHDPKFDQYSVGSLLTMHMMEHVLDRDQVSKIDFLSGDDSYKKDWMNAREERWGLQISNQSTPKGLYRAIKNGLLDLYKRLTAKHINRENY